MAYSARPFSPTSPSKDGLSDQCLLPNLTQWWLPTARPNLSFKRYTQAKEKRHDAKEYERLGFPLPPAAYADANRYCSRRIAHSGSKAPHSWRIIVVVSRGRHACRSLSRLYKHIYGLSPLKSSDVHPIRRSGQHGLLRDKDWRGASYNHLAVELASPLPRRGIYVTWSCLSRLDLPPSSW